MSNKFFHVFYQYVIWKSCDLFMVFWSLEIQDRVNMLKMNYSHITNYQRFKFLAFLTFIRALNFSKSLVQSTNIHSVKSARIRSFSGPHFSHIQIRYSVSLRIQSECGKMRTRITPNTDTFYAVILLVKIPFE